MSGIEIGLWIYGIGYIINAFFEARMQIKQALEINESIPAGSLIYDPFSLFFAPFLWPVSLLSVLASTLIQTFGAPIIRGIEKICLMTITDTSKRK